MPDKPLVSVCLLSYNLEHFIGKVINSVINQTFRDFEFIISDDCSTDESWDLIKGYSGKYDFIRPFKQEKNIGMAKNANFCFSVAEGKYIALLSHDDPIHPTLLEKWLKVIEKDENISFVFNDYLIKGGIASHKDEKRNFKEVMDGNWFLKKHLLKYWGCPIRIGAFLRKSSIDKAGGMDEKFGILADVDLWMRLSANYKIGYVSEPMIEVFSVWKEDYPEDYISFSWHRLFLLFDIHAENIKRVCGWNIYRWFLFRLRVNFNLFKWISYAVIKRKKEIIINSGMIKNDYEFLILKIYRSLIKRIFS